MRPRKISHLVKIDGLTQICQVLCSFQGMFCVFWSLRVGRGGQPDKSAAVRKGGFKQVTRGRRNSYFAYSASAGDIFGRWKYCVFAWLSVRRRARNVERDEAIVSQLPGVELKHRLDRERSLFSQKTRVCVTCQDVVMSANCQACIPELSISRSKHS